MLLETVEEDDTFVVITKTKGVIQVLEALFRWFFKVEEIIDAALNKLHELLKEAQGKKKCSTINKDNIIFDIENWEVGLAFMEAVVHWFSKGSAWDELNRSVCTSLGHLTVTDFNAEEGSKENRTSPDKSSGYFFYLGKFPGVSSRDEDRKNDAGALEVAVEIEESKRPTEELVARVVDIEDQVSRSCYSGSSIHKLVEDVLSCFIVEVVKLDNFMNYVGNLESQSSVEGVILALKQNMKDMETEVKALEQKIKKLRTSLKYSDFVLTIKVLADACGIDLKK
ncbi:hypothetical protein CDL15_Pgr011243 [Punica granatum]|uniref:Uncharacterized protein n=1 Tax=Punica granatum TaxID=22663 RepID=A0A218WEK6_PUNGR|nr:hypothetical protein CDL15_Pgr011243 [Punica granatum]